ncbi:hypothetical protein QE368_002974 [Asaia bogorensis NBRC 16594]|nr:hypothetical protein [Asaia bogorensis NBRC 16594]
MRFGSVEDADQMRSGCKFLFSPYTNANSQFELCAAFIGERCDTRVGTRIGYGLCSFSGHRGVETVLVRRGVNTI